MLRIVSRLVSIIVLLGSVSLFAVDGAVLINQATVTAAGGFPYKITQPGSYKLSSNLVVPADTDGIRVLTSGVTIDLNGFGIIGAINCDTASCLPVPTVISHGIISRIGALTVRNGHVRGFHTGIFTEGGLVEDVQLLSNSAFGTNAFNAVLRRNNVAANGGTGIGCGSCVVTENVVTSNAGQAAILAEGTVFGSNLFFRNGSLLLTDASSVSQHNSSCVDNNGNGGPC